MFHEYNFFSFTNLCGSNLIFVFHVMSDNNIILNSFKNLVDGLTSFIISGNELNNLCDE